MKKKRKRSASSSSSSSASSRDSSASSSSSSSRRRSKKKKKKRRRSDRGSKRHRRISSRESSRRSEEDKSERDRKGEEEDDEVEWYPAPPNTSATFLDQKGGPGFGERGEEEVDVEDRRISHLYSLSAASDDDESDRKGRDRKESETRRGERTSRSRERSDKSRERGKEDNRKDRRDSDENRRRKVSCSSAESEYSRKSSVKSEYLGNSGSASKRVESRMRHDSSKRNSVDGGRYENRGREEIREVDEAKREKGKVEEERRRSDGGNGRRSDGAGNHKQSGLTSAPGGTTKKELPSNLLDIFNQIAQFEKEKGGRPK